MELSVVAAAREGSPFSEPLDIAVVADRLGFGEVWAGEGPTWDCFALATAKGGPPAVAGGVPLIWFPGMYAGFVV